jgi:hypothetical protein
VIAGGEICKEQPRTRLQRNRTKENGDDSKKKETTR